MRAGTTQQSPIAMVGPEARSVVRGRMAQSASGTTGTGPVRTQRYGCEVTEGATTR